MNARFWAWYNGSPVRLTIRQGQTLRWATGGRTDEGWFRECVEWELLGMILYRRDFADGADCDGRLSTSAECYCHLEDLASGSTDPDDPAIGYPCWERLESSQRDYAAEAAGY